MARIFISHSHKDAPFIINQLKPLFSRLGYSTWCSGSDVRSAEDWEHQIRDALASADWFVALLSPNAAQSEWVQAEIHWALENKRGRVIPLMISPCNPSDVHLRLGTLQYVDFTTDARGARERLLAVMQGRTVRTTGITALPAANVPAMPDSEQATTIMTECRVARVRLWIEPAQGSPREQTLSINNWALVGRAKDVDLHLDDHCVSRRHARIAVVPGGGAKRLTLTDLESANGILINRHAVVGDQPLAVGDVIEVGNTRLTVRGID